MWSALLLSGQFGLDLAVVDPEKLVCTGSHVDVVGFPLRTFSVEEMEHGIIRFCLEQRGHDQEQRLSQSCRSALGRIVAFADAFAGFVHAGVNSRIGGDRLSMRKP